MAPKVQVLQSVLIPANPTMAQAVQPVPANLTTVQAAQPVPANPTTVQAAQRVPANPRVATFRRIGTNLQRRTGTTKIREVTKIVTLLYATQYTDAVRQHHIRTISVILERTHLPEDINYRRLLPCDHRIRVATEEVCNNVERALMHGVRILEILFFMLFCCVTVSCSVMAA